MIPRVRRRPPRAVLSVLVVSAFVAGCGERVPPAAPDSLLASVPGLPEAGFKPLTLRLPEAAALRATRIAPVRVSEVIPAGDGGRLVLNWEAEDAASETVAKIRVALKVPPGALEKDTRISITLTNPSYAMVDVDLSFGRHGTTFRIPAEVKLLAEGLDLSGCGTPDDVDLYWRDRDTRTWYPVPFEYKDVDLDRGNVRGLWYFEHFSMYSLSDGDD